MEPLRSACPFLEEEASSFLAVCRCAWLLCREAQRHLDCDLKACVYLEVQSNEEPLFSYMLRFVSKSVQQASSIRADMGKGRGPGADDDDIDDLLVMVKGKGKAGYVGLCLAKWQVGGASRKRKREVQMPLANIGLGWHSFDFAWDEQKAKITVVLQRIGNPTGGFQTFWLVELA